MARDLRARLRIKELYRLYLEEKRSLEDIARMYGVSRVTIWNYCKASGLERRNRSEARIEAQKNQKVPQRHLNINENFFSSWSPEMAYVLGLLITDGCLSKVKNGSYRISLCLNDKELIEKVAKSMRSDHTITPSAHQKGLYIFIFGRQKLAQDLIKLGMKPQKSLDVKFPDVPKEYLKIL
jgi:DNA-binding transcriptional regulator WhiA